MKKNYNLKGLTRLLNRDALKQTCLRSLQFMLFAALISFSISANAQNTRSGTITDSKTKEPLIGASIKVKGTTNGVSTDGDGKFTINAPQASVLLISGIGYTTEQVTVGSSNVINVSLDPVDVSLSEVVVVGYGTQKRTTLTGAIASVNSKTLSEISAPSVEQSLQGRVTGLTVTNNGSPGTAPIVAIRGISSISFSSEPLYVIDGIPSGSLASFDSRDIEGVEVLKDASAAAIYGSRATNGVIIITTKKGKNGGGIKVNFDSFAGVQSPTKKLDLLNTAQFLQYERALNGAAGIAAAPRFAAPEFNKPIYAGATQTYAQTNTDWQDEYFVKNALMTGNNIAVLGGNEVSRFYSSAGYFKQEGIAQALSYERGNFRINSDHILSKRFTFGQNLYISLGDQRFDATGGNRTPLANVIRMQPYLPVYDPTTVGGFRGPQNSFDGSDPMNPVETALIGRNAQKTTKILGTAYLDVNITSWLKFNSTFGLDHTNGYRQNYTPIFNDGGTGNSPLAAINNERGLVTSKVFTERLTATKSFGQHNLKADVIYEQQGTSFKNEQASGNQQTNSIKTINGGTNIAATATDEENLIQSYIGRVSYDFAGKYLLNASIRRDGLSIWAPGNKYASFPAISAGWRIDQEEFLKGSATISELKLRGGYGETGINSSNFLGNYPYIAPLIRNTTYPFNNALDLANGVFTNRIPNPDLEWEKTKQFNVGLDLGFLENKITVVAEYFKRRTDNMMLAIPTASSIGFNQAGTFGNVGSMSNTGVELQLGYHKRTGEFKWNVTGLVSRIRNNVNELVSASSSLVAGGDPDFGGGGPITNTVVGRPIQSFYGLVVEGIFQNAAEVAASPAQNRNTANPNAPQTAPGDIKFKDLNGDKVINNDDRTFLGSFIPDFTYSLNYSASFKNLDLSVFFQGVQGNELFNGTRILTGGMQRLFNAGTEVLNAWTPTNTNTDIPRAISGDPNGNVRPSTRWIEDGSFLRLKNLSVGYNMPVSTMQSINKGFSRLRVYVSAQNLFTVTKYKGFDPEIGSRNGTITNGIDYGQYPTARLFQLGIQAGF